MLTYMYDFHARWQCHHCIAYSNAALSKMKLWGNTVVFLVMHVR